MKTKKAKAVDAKKILQKGFTVTKAWTNRKFAWLNGREEICCGYLSRLLRITELRANTVVLTDLGAFGLGGSSVCLVNLGWIFLWKPRMQKQWTYTKRPKNNTPKRIYRHKKPEGLPMVNLAWANGSVFHEKFAWPNGRARIRCGCLSQLLRITDFGADWLGLQI
jgi:hypothetical protein